MPVKAVTMQPFPKATGKTKQSRLGISSYAFLNAYKKNTSHLNLAIGFYTASYFPPFLVSTLHLKKSCNEATVRASILRSTKLRETLNS